MSYSHLTPFERGRLENLFRLGWSTRAITKELKRNHSTIAREIKRNVFQFSYHSVAAHERYNDVVKHLFQKERGLAISLDRLMKDEH